MIQPVENLVPHRQPMLWLESLLEVTDTTATATARFEPGALATDGTNVLEAALVEIAAQTIAAAAGHRAAAERERTGSPPAKPGTGMLVSVSNFKIHMRPAAGTHLRIETREQKRLGPMLMITTSITAAGAPVATGELTLYA